MSKWQKSSYPGVRFREHKERKHGPRLDRYFSIYYQLDGKKKEEGLGWASEGWSAEKASNERAQLRKAQKTGEGPRTMRERRELAEAERQAEMLRREEERAQSVTMYEYFYDTYLRKAWEVKKESTCATEGSMFAIWIAPVVKCRPFKSLAASDLENIRRSILEAGKSPRQVEYVFAVFRQVWNKARRDGYAKGKSPTTEVELPSKDNRRMRFLTWDEAEQLLEELSVGSQQHYSMALISLYCGLRAGEIFALTWGDVDLEGETLLLKDTKSGKSRTAYMPTNVVEHMTKLGPGKPNELVFPTKHGTMIKSISRGFFSAVDRLGLNDDVDDPRDKVVFHTLRHTYASWLVAKGVDLYTVKELMGHGSIAMTERYSHVRESALKAASKVLEE